MKDIIEEKIQWSKTIGGFNFTDFQAEKFGEILTSIAKTAEERGIETGRVSVLQDFDDMCLADAFLGFSREEWEAIRNFFAVNKKISGWDSPTESNNT